MLQTIHLYEIIRKRSLQRKERRMRNIAAENYCCRLPKIYRPSSLRFETRDAEVQQCFCFFWLLEPLKMNDVLHTTWVTKPRDRAVVRNMSDAADVMHGMHGVANFRVLQRPNRLHSTFEVNCTGRIQRLRCGLRICQLSIVVDSTSRNQR